MAEFALGLTKTAVEGTLSLVKSAVEEENKLREAVHSDLVFISDEFEMMRSFLRIANRECAVNDEVTLTLVRQLRTLAFDVEDCFENVVHLDLDESCIWGALRRLRRKFSCGAPQLPLDEAVAEIKQLKARVEDVSVRNKRYNHILHGSDDDTTNNKQRPVTFMPLPADDATTIFDPSSAASHALHDAWEATGKLSSNICNLQQELLIAREGEGGLDLQVISVWESITCTGGGADLGTTSIFRKVYRDPKICENFKIRAWVKLTHPFNHEEFIKSLVAQFYASSSHQANTRVDWTRMKVAEVMEADNLMKAKLVEQRFLVVLEDVSTLEEWDVIRMYLPNRKNGSRILLSTPQLGMALLCAGEPYQVSELRNFSADNQFLCAFSKKEESSSDIREFYRQLLRGHGVISVWGGDDDEKSNLVDILYRGIINDWLEEIIGRVAEKSDHVDMFYEGIRARRRKFEQRHSSWVDVPDPFDLKVFAQRLFLNFHSDDIRANEIIEVGKKGETGLIQWCREFLSDGKGYPYVVVIYGLRSEGDWDLIQSKFFSSNATTAKAGCILVITKEQTVATHCVKHHTHLAFDAKDLKADPSISALIRKGCWHYAIRGKMGRLFYDRKKHAQEWANKFGNVGRIILDPIEGKDEKGFHVFLAKGGKKNEFMVKQPSKGEKVVALVHEGGNSEKGVLRHAYYGALFQQQTDRRCSWVDSPCHKDSPWDFVRLNLTDFWWRLLLDFYSDDPQAKEQVAVGLMEGTIIDPIQKCREFLRNKKCFVVINGLLQSKEDWDRISTFFSNKQHTQCIIIVRSTEHDSIYDTTKELQLDTQEQGRLIDKEYRCIFSTRKRYQEAIKWFQTHQPVGRDTEVDAIRFPVLTENLVAVWGLSGVGKSTLARTVYYTEILYSSGLESSYGLGPTEAFAWVDVPNPFNLTDFAWRLLLDFYSDDPQAKESAVVSMMKESRQVPIVECRKILRTGKCLVVMDGLCSKKDWNLIKGTFLAERIEATIVVITNEQEVAMYCAKNDNLQAINIAPLNANAARRLFEKINAMAPNSLVDKCGGLSEVIASMGACNSNRMQDSLGRNCMGTLETNPELHGLRPLFSWMKSYFDACSDSTKPCIFYLSIFDAEKNIRRRRLLWRCIAEGYCRDTSDGRTCEENWEKFLSELVRLSIIQESASSDVFCRINGLFHEYIISRPMEGNLVFALDKGCSLNSTRGGQHLTIRSSWNRTDEVVYESIDFSRLRSLTVFGPWNSFFICSKKVNMRLLRVLDLEDATHDVSNGDLRQIAERLTRLKFLSLRGHTEIAYLPGSMDRLRQLQTLDIRGTSILTLPVFITKLKKLRYIRAGTTAEVWDWRGDVVAADIGDNRASAAADGEEDRASSSAPGGTGSNRPGTLVSSLLSRFPICCGGGADDNSGPIAGVTVLADIGKLTMLHTLGVVKVNAPCCKDTDIFSKLEKLTQLHKLGVSGINKRNINKFVSAVAHHAHLKSLSVELDRDDGLDDSVLHDLPPKSIKSLKLYGRIDKLLPVWMKHLSNLKKLHVTIKKAEELQGLPSLPNEPDIRRLRVRPIQGGELDFGDYWFKTEVVEIQCPSKLHIKLDGLSELEALKVHFTGGSQSSLQISGLSDLCQLKEVWLKGYTDAHKQDMERQLKEVELDQRPVLKLVGPCSP